MEKPYDLRLRTKLFSLETLNLIEGLPHSRTFSIIYNQLGRAALSVGANYRVVSRAKSNRDFINKLKIELLSIVVASIIKARKK